MNRGVAGDDRVAKRWLSRPRLLAMFGHLVAIVSLAGCGASYSNTPIPQIQGTSHRSPHVGATVTTTGIVTGLIRNGFHLQDPVGDGNDATSDALFVFTGTVPTVAVGDSVQVTGRVEEFIPGGASGGNLSQTQIRSTSITTLATGVALPTPVILGRGGRVPPADILISANELPVNLNDPAAVASNTFNPDIDGIDFYESLESMRVTIEDAVAISAIEVFSNDNQEVFVLANQGADATPAGARTTRGGLSLVADPDNQGDQHPERLQIQFTTGLYPGTAPGIQVGDRLGNVTGVLGYSFGNFEVLATELIAVNPSTITPEVSDLVGTADQVTIASYNVLNLSPNGAQDDQRKRLAKQIVDHLRSPDILALQEIQDNSATSNDGIVDADITLQRLADTIVAAGGPKYEFVDAPPANGADGGAPGGNIRNAYLYNPDRVTLTEQISLTHEKLDHLGITHNNAFNATRKPHVATFTFGGKPITLVNVHLSSRSGSSPIFGAIQPFRQGGQSARANQAAVLNAYVQQRLAASPAVPVVVLGDFNTFEFTRELTETLPAGPTGPILRNLGDTITDGNRYTYIFQGNSQNLDHIFVTPSIPSDAVEFDIVHVNTDFPKRPRETASDHEPLLTRIKL